MPDGYGNGMDLSVLNAIHRGGDQQAQQNAINIETLMRAHVVHLRDDHDMTMKQIADKTGIKFSIVRELINA